MQSYTAAVQQFTSIKSLMLRFCAQRDADSALKSFHFEAALNDGVE